MHIATKEDKAKYTQSQNEFRMWAYENEYEVYHYQGRMWHSGPAIKVDRYDVTDVLTRLTEAGIQGCKADSLGMGAVIYR